MALTGPHLPPASGTVKRMVMFLHGYGANGDDLLPIGHEWAGGLPDTVFVSPHAPEVCEQSSFGYQWFSIRAIDKASFEREKQIEKVTPILSAHIDAELARWGVTEENLAVVGFSQGAMMAMYTMPRRKTPCAGVIGYSGMLIDPQGLIGQGIVKPPVLAVHGDRDEVVPPFYLEGVQQGFETAGFDVETVLRPGLGHGIDGEGLALGLAFLRRVFRI